MIEKYYASHIKTTIDATAINVRKARAAKKGDAPVQKPLLESAE